MDQLYKLFTIGVFIPLMQLLLDCPAPKSGFIASGSEVASGCNGCSTTGWMDCAQKCGAKPSCKAWTLHKTSNRCWLKTDYKYVGNHMDWSWLLGMPCKSPGKNTLSSKRFNYGTYLYCIVNSSPTRLDGDTEAGAVW